MALSIEAQQQEFRRTFTHPSEARRNHRRIPLHYTLHVLPARLYHHRRPILCRRRRATLRSRGAPNHSISYEGAAQSAQKNTVARARTRPPCAVDDDFGLDQVPHAAENMLLHPGLVGLSIGACKPSCLKVSMAALGSKLLTEG
jgi:hypothetical protein